MVLFASTALAQNKLSTKILKYEGISSQGFSVSYVRPSLEYNANLTGNNFSKAMSGKLDQTNGLSFGYVSLPIQSLGWTANTTLLEIKNNEISVQVGRADGNLAYAFNKYINVKGGFNLSQFIKSETAEKYNAGFGFQAGLGFQMTKNVGLDVGFTEIHQSGKISVNNGISSKDYDIDYKLSGLELGLTGTF